MKSPKDSELAKNTREVCDMLHARDPRATSYMYTIYNIGIYDAVCAETVYGYAM